MKTIHTLIHFGYAPTLYFWVGCILLTHSLWAQQTPQENPAIIELGQLENDRIRVTAKVKTSATYRAYDLRLQYKIPATQKWKNTNILFTRVNKKNTRGNVQSWTVKVSPQTVPWDSEGNIAVRLIPVGRYQSKKIHLPIISSLATGGLIGLGYYFQRLSEDTYELYEEATNTEEARNLDRANAQFRNGTLMYYGGILTGLVSAFLWWKAKFQDDGLRKIDANKNRIHLGLGGAFNLPQLTLTIKF
ncbi:MAG TPA: hypothetical protein DCS93_07050 [Microscillaceae bacterium]|nr:hypothetical protein [Microscillaceae bacterium]